jgi:L,D-transpeptidase ErfK/SrfK
VALRWRSIAAIVSVAIAMVQPSAAQPTSIVGSCFQYHAVKGDSLYRVGARFGVTPKTLAAINRFPSEHRLRVDEELTVCNQHLVPQILEEGILINIPQRMLFHFQNGNVSAYPVAVGRRGWHTPTGTFHVKTKVINPTWYVPTSIREEMGTIGLPIPQSVPPSPENPLGKHWIGLNVAGFGIHGTNAPASIHTFQTHGCIRLLPEHVAELYDKVRTGTPVVLIYEPVLMSQAEQTVYLEVHSDEYDRGRVGIRGLSALAHRQGIHEQVNWELVRAEMKRSSGLARPVSN